MRTSLYDAIGVSSGSPIGEIRAALRALVRRFWAVPRDPAGDSEEALRFVSLAAGILTDERRRDNYDASLSPGVGAGPWRLPLASARQSAIDHPTDLPSGGAIEVGVSQLSVDVAREATLPSVEAFAEHFPGDASRPMVWIAVATLTALLVTAGVSVFVAHTVGKGLVTGFAIAGVIVLAAALIGAATAQSARKAENAQSLSNLAVVKWRRDGSVFIGVPPPQQDTAWLFRLRMAELTRSANGFLVQPVPWRRTLARAFDLALAVWPVLAVILGIAQFLPDAWAGPFMQWALSPLILPTLTVLAWLAVEPVLMARYGWSPGKWLLGLYAVSGVTHVGPRPRALVRAAARERARQIARHGLALGFLPATLRLLRRHWETLRDDEPRWDSASDTVVLARPVAWLPATASALIVLAATVAVATLWLTQFAGLARAASAWISTLEPPSLVTFARDTGALQPDPSPSRPSEPPAAPVRAPANAPARNGATPPPAPASGRESAPAPDARIASQTAAAQSRRARIERAEAAVAAVRRGQGSYAAIEAICQRWTQDQPGSAEAWRCYGLAQYERGAGTAALPALRTALRLDPKDPEVERAILMILRPQ